MECTLCTIANGQCPPLCFSVVGVPNPPTRMNTFFFAHTQGMIPNNQGSRSINPKYTFFRNKIWLEVFTQTCTHTSSNERFLRTLNKPSKSLFVFQMDGCTTALSAGCLPLLVHLRLSVGLWYFPLFFSFAGSPVSSAVCFCGLKPFSCLTFGLRFFLRACLLFPYCAFLLLL